MSTFAGVIMTDVNGIQSRMESVISPSMTPPAYMLTRKLATSTRENIALAEDRSSALLAIAPPAPARAQYRSIPVIIMRSAMMQFAGLNIPSAMFPSILNPCIIIMSVSGFMERTILDPIKKLMTRPKIQLNSCMIPVSVMASSLPRIIAAGFTATSILSMSFELFSVTTLLATPCP